MADLSNEELHIQVRLSAIPLDYGHAVGRTLSGIFQNIYTYGIAECIKSNCVSKDGILRVNSWNTAPLTAPKICLHHLVEEGAQSAPNTLAIDAWDGALTYQELDSLSNGLARSLGSLGVGPGIFVPFAFEKSCWTTVAMLGVLKAGGAFVPLDPTDPEPRLQGLLADVGARILLTSSSYESQFRPLVEHVVVVTSTTIKPVEEGPTAEAQHCVVRSTDPVFVLFTSGSTGRPKGIIHEHGAMSAHTLALGENVGYSGVRTLQFSAYTWDIAVIDTFTTLAFKGCLCIPSEEDRRFGITHAINAMKAELAILTPSFTSLLDPEAIPTIRTLLLCGEALKQETVRRWANKVSLFQGYGPAEVGICTLQKITSHTSRAEIVGKPLNSRCVLVDSEDHDKLVPTGSTGELLVAGPSIAREYLHDQEKTLSSFVVDPAWATEFDPAYRRFYKTGDLLKYNVQSFDGALDFVGRKDIQIKRHGQRVDLGEIEHHLADIPNVTMSMLAVPCDGCFKGDLVAVVQLPTIEPTGLSDTPLTIVPSETLTLDSMIDYLSSHLPRYMLPTAFLSVTSIPFSSSMKLERRKVDSWLAAMTTRPPQNPGTCRASKTSLLSPMETTAIVISRKVADLLAGIDSEYRQTIEGHNLGLQQAGVDSIQLISLSIFLQQIYKIKLPMSMILSSKVTIRDLASFIDGNDKASTSIEDESIKLDVLEEAKQLTKDLVRDVTKSLQPNEFKVFLTGGTGFLGSEVLRQLLQRPGFRVYNLVRASDEHEAMRRIVERATTEGWWDSSYLSRLEAWKGDMACPNLGLDVQHLRYFGMSDDNQNNNGAEEWSLHERIDAIIHLGAKVHYNLDLPTVAPTNVSSTRDLLRLTVNSRAEAVLASKSSPNRNLDSSNTSTVQTFTYISGALQISPFEDDDVQMASQVRAAGGYEQSKLMAELLVKQCAQQPLFRDQKIRVVKMGYIIGDETGRVKPNTRDFIWRLVAACLEIGAFNADESKHWLFIASVDDVAKCVVDGILPDAFPEQRYRAQSGCKVVKALAGMPVADFWDVLRRHLGYDLLPLPYEQWLLRIKDAVSVQLEKHPLFPVMHILERGSSIVGSEHAPTERGEGERERMRRVVTSNVKRLVEVGFLPVAEKQKDSLGERDRELTGEEKEIDMGAGIGKT